MIPIVKIFIYKYWICTSTNFKRKPINCMICIDNSNYLLISPITSSVLIRKCNFTKINPADQSGAAIRINNNDNFKITDCTFDSTKGYNTGGAISAGVENVEIRSTFFIDNEALTHQSSEESRGSAIYYSKLGESQLIVSCVFKGNKAKTYGGAIFLSFLENNFIIKNSFKNDDSIFTECESGCSGAIYFQDGTKESNEPSEIRSSIFTNCFASSGEGYAISSRAYLTTIEQCVYKYHNREAETLDHCILYVEFDAE